jgi:hypothetical protein
MQPRSARAAAPAARFPATGPGLRPKTSAISIASPVFLPTTIVGACSVTATAAPPWSARSAFRRRVPSTMSGRRFAVLASPAMKLASWRGNGSVCNAPRYGAATSPKQLVPPRV